MTHELVLQVLSASKKRGTTVKVKCLRCSNCTVMALSPDGMCHTIPMNMPCPGSIEGSVKL